MLGGDLMRLLDTVAFIAATRHARAPLVTAGAAGFDLASPIRVGDLILIGAEVTATGNRSLKVRADVSVHPPVVGSTDPMTAAFIMVRTSQRQS